MAAGLPSVCVLHGLAAEHGDPRAVGAHVAQFAVPPARGAQRLVDGLAAVREDGVEQPVRDPAQRRRRLPAVRRGRAGVPVRDPVVALADENGGRCEFEEPRLLAEFLLRAVALGDVVQTPST